VFIVSVIVTPRIFTLNVQCVRLDAIVIILPFERQPQGVRRHEESLATAQQLRGTGERDGEIRRERTASYFATWNPVTTWFVPAVISRD